MPDKMYVEDSCGICKEAISNLSVVALCINNGVVWCLKCLYENSEERKALTRALDALEKIKEETHIADHDTAVDRIVRAYYLAKTAIAVKSSEDRRMRTWWRIGSHTTSELLTAMADQGVFGWWGTAHVDEIMEQLWAEREGFA